MPQKQRSIIDNKKESFIKENPEETVRAKSLQNENKLLTIVEKIKKTLYDHKAEQIEVYDVRPGLSYTDIIVVASGAAPLHLKTLYTYVRKELQQNGMETILPSKRITENCWHVLDYGDIVVHLILPENRMHYKLDELYAKLSVNG